MSIWQANKRIWPGLIMAVLLTCTVTLANEQPRNLFHNGSFELGWSDEFGRVFQANDTTLINATWLTDEVAYHGKYALKLVRPKPFYGNSLTLRCFSFPFLMPEVRLYRLSVRVRAIAGEETVRIRAMHPHVAFMEGPKKGINPQPIKNAEQILDINSESWQLMEVTAAGSATKNVYLEITGENIYIDAIQVLADEAPTGAGADGVEEEGDEELLDLGEDLGDDQAPQFVATAPVECAVLDDTIAHVHHQGKDLVLPLSFRNYSATDHSAVVAYRIVNHDKALIVEGEHEAVMVKAGASHRQDWRLPPMPNGKFSLQYWVKGAEDAWDELVFSVIPEPRKDAPTGALTNLTPPMVRMMNQAGIVHFATLCSSIRMYRNYNRETGELEDLSQLLKWGQEGGIQTCINLNPMQFQSEIDHPWNERMPSRHPTTTFDRKVYFDAVHKFAKLYAPYSKMWWIQDEVEGGAHPHHFADIFNETVEVIRQYRPDAEFLISAMGPWLDQFSRVDDLRNLDWVGGSIMHYTGDMGKKIGWIVQRHKKRTYMTAGAFTNYRPFGRRVGSIHASWRLHQAILNSIFLHRAEATMMYRALPASYDWSMVHDPFNVLEPDLSPTCALTLYIIAGQLMAGAEIEPAPLTTSGYHPSDVWGFVDGRTKRPAVCFFPGDERELLLAMEEGTFEFRDELGNPIKVARRDGMAVLPLGKRHRFLYANGLEKTAFLKQVAGSATHPSQAPAPETEIIAQYVADDNEALKVAVTAINRSKEPITHREGFAEPTAPGTHQTITVDSTYRSRIKGFPRYEQPLGAHVSLACSSWRKTAPTIDGDFGDWGPVRSAAIYYNQSALGHIDRRYVHAFKDSFKVLADFGKDLRVEFFSGYDEQALYFCARVFDDEVRYGIEDIERDHLEVRLYQDFAKQNAAERVGPADVVLRLTPQKAGNMHILREKGGTQTELACPSALQPLNAADLKTGWQPWAPVEGPVGYQFEAAIPWQELGMSAKPGTLLGFDVYAHELDGTDIKEYSVLRWAGGCKVAGQLQLLKP